LVTYLLLIVLGHNELKFETLTLEAMLKMINEPQEDLPELFPPNAHRNNAGSIEAPGTLPPQGVNPVLGNKHPTFFRHVLARPFF
jgi:hypothetical protein